MNFRRAIRRDEPEINFIPLIDLLLVILIFLMVTTTYSKFTELQLNLPSAGGAVAEQKREIAVAVGADGRYVIGNRAVTFRSSATLADELRRAAADLREPRVVIHADASATHQAVVRVLEAARLAGLAHVSFAAQTTSGTRRP